MHFKTGGGKPNVEEHREEGLDVAGIYPLIYEMRAIFVKSDFFTIIFYIIHMFKRVFPIPNYSSFYIDCFEFLNFL